MWILVHTTIILVLLIVTLILLFVAQEPFKKILMDSSVWVDEVMALDYYQPDYNVFMSVSAKWG
jgi:hypothetical protein